MGTGTRRDYEVIHGNGGIPESDAAPRECSDVLIVHEGFPRDDRAGHVMCLDEDALFGGKTRLPHNDEPPVGSHRDRWASLVSHGGRIDNELPAEGTAEAVVPLAEDAAIGAVLAVGFPHDDEVAGRIHGDVGIPLVYGHVGVDLKLGSDFPVGGDG